MNKVTKNKIIRTALSVLLCLVVAVVVWLVAKYDNYSASAAVSVITRGL